MAHYPYVDYLETDFQYRMRTGHRGIAIVISNDKFDSELNVCDRIDSHNQTDNMRSGLRLLNFKDIRIMENLTGKEMIQRLTKVVNDEYRYKRMDCFFLAVLSYGDNSCIYGTDILVSFNMLLEPLRGLSHIPKIVIIQACPPEIPPSRHLQETLAREDIPRCPGVEYLYDVIPPELNPLTRHSDIVLAYSVLRGFQFIEALCDVFRRDGRRLEIMQLLARTTRMMSYGTFSHPTHCEPNKDLPSPCVFSVLTKDLYFY